MQTRDFICQEDVWRKDSMNKQDTVKLAYTNIIRRKKQTIINIALLVLALLILLSTSSISKSIMVYLENNLFNQPSFRTLFVDLYIKDNEGEKRLYEICKEDSRIIEIKERVEPIFCEIKDNEEIFKNIVGEDASLGVRFESEYIELAKDIVKGKSIGSLEQNVGVIPKYFYPDGNVIPGFVIKDEYNNDIKYLDGEEFIGKTITIQYESEKWSEEKNTYVLNNTFTYEFEVIGVYDNVRTKESQITVYIPYNDLKKIINNKHEGDKRYEGNESKVFFVTVDSSNNVDVILKKLLDNGFGTDRVTKPSEIFIIGKYISLIGKIISIIILIISIINISLSIYNDIKKRTTEIGMLKAIGYTNSNIKHLIITESIIVGLISIIVSIILSIITLIIIGKIIESRSTIYFVNFRLVINYLWLMITICIGIIIPVISSIKGIKKSIEVTPLMAIKN